MCPLKSFKSVTVTVACMGIECMIHGTMYILTKAWILYFSIHPSLVHQRELCRDHSCHLSMLVCRIWDFKFITCSTKTYLISNLLLAFNTITVKPVYCSLERECRKLTIIHSGGLYITVEVLVSRHRSKKNEVASLVSNFSSVYIV